MYSTYSDKLLDYRLEVLDCREHERVDAHLALQYGKVSLIVPQHNLAGMFTGFFHLVSQSCL